MDNAAILELVQSLVGMLSKGRSAEAVSSVSDDLRAFGDKLREGSEVFYAAANATQDGVVSWEEIENMLAEMRDVK